MTQEDNHPSFMDELDAAMLLAPQVADGACGSPAQDMRKQFASQYETARRHKLTQVTSCEACGKTHGKLMRENAHLETHHAISIERIFTEGLPTDLIGDPENLVVLCRRGDIGCHRAFGHPNGWRTSNPNVRADARKHLLEVN